MSDLNSVGARVDLGPGPQARSTSSSAGSSDVLGSGVQRAADLVAVAGAERLVADQVARPPAQLHRDGRLAAVEQHHARAFGREGVGAGGLGGWLGASTRCGLGARPGRPFTGEQMRILGDEEMAGVVNERRAGCQGLVFAVLVADGDRLGGDERRVATADLEAGAVGGAHFDYPAHADASRSR